VSPSRGGIETRTSLHSIDKSNKTTIRLSAIFFIAVLLAGPLTPVEAAAAAEQARRAIEDSVLKFLSVGLSKQSVQTPSSQRFESPSQRAERVSHLRLCPRELLLYVDESFTLVPLPLDQDNNAVHGADLTFEAKDSGLATVSSWGEVSAMAPGHTQVTVQAGTTKAHVNVEVRAGLRPRSSDRRQADLDWRTEHSHDCDDPEAAQLIEPRPDLAAHHNSTATALTGTQIKDAETDSVGDEVQGTGQQPFGRLARPAVFRKAHSPEKSAIKTTTAAASASGKLFGRGFFQIGGIDGDGPDPVSTAAAAPYNAVGSPRFGPVEQSQGSAAKTKNNLGSSDYVFSAPVLGLSGRGIDVNLALTCNSRVWTKEAAGMTFNYGKGWPAAGWTLGYGRLIENYDNQLNWLLIQPDGTRIHLQKQTGGSLASTDGSFIRMGVGAGGAPNGKLRYPDGTLVTYSNAQNGRWLPLSIRSRNGDRMNIAYMQYNNTPGDPHYFPYMWAISQITDTLGRIITFNYYGDTGYPEDTTGARPKYALAAITTPDQNGTTRTMVRIDYQTVTLQYDFSVPVDPNYNPASGSQITVLKRIYYPATGRGYLFQDYSTYGMARRISVCFNMTGGNGAITDGSEIAYTKYNYTTMAPNDPYDRTQVGHLNDSPQYAIRSEWWQGKTDNNGASTTATTDYTYSRSSVTDPVLGEVEIDKVSYPNGMDMLTTSGNDQAISPESFGHVVKTEIKSGSTSLRTAQPSYVTDSSGGDQLRQMVATDEAGNTAKTSYDYYSSYGRLQNVNEYGFSASIQRKTTFQYSDTLANANLLQVAKQIDVLDGSGNPVARTVFTLDDYGADDNAGNNAMKTYTIMPPSQTHDASFDQHNQTRGNVTGVTTWVQFGTTAADDIKITRNSKFDVFGNVVQADVSCCQVKNISYLDGSSNPLTFYSQPISVTDGTSGTAPFLTTTYQYDFNTGLLTNTTDPNGLLTSYMYDPAWRLKTVNAPSLAVTTTQFDRDSNNFNDQLAYLQQVTYKEKDTDPDSAKKTITSRSWVDGAGRVLRSGGGAGSSPASFDTVATVYDSMGRVLKQSNPYSGDQSGSAGTGVTLYWTQNSYDSLSRVTTVTLPDNQTVQTAYSGTTVTVTDQVGRKRKSEVDGLGRLTRVTEQDTATGALTWDTTYGYDLLNNLTSVNQGDQIRLFGYDALSRMTGQITPEGGPVAFTYTDFGAVLKRTDARNVETHYKYDSLNRLSQVWYTGLNGNDSGTFRPNLPPGVAATADLNINYNNFTTAQAGNGQVHQITDGAGSESYAYDSLARPSSKIRTVGNFSYQTQYQYNQANQLTVMIYPSGKRVRMNRDSRGRLGGEDNVDAADNVLTSYVSSIGYNEAGQTTGLSLGNGVSENYGYSADRLQLTSQTATSFAESLINVKYIYQTVAGDSGALTTANNSGQLMMISGAIGPQSRTERFTYDDLGRLATAYGKGLWGRRYSYDRWGNRTAVYDATSGGNQIQSVTLELSGGVPTTNRIASVGGVSYSYDESGNLTSDEVHNYQYDAEGRMVTVDGGSTSSCSYDLANRRVKKVAGGVTTHYVWEGSQVIAEYNGSTGVLISEYVFAGSRMAAREQSGIVRYFLQDRLSTRLITDSSGNLVGREDHLPFGEDSGTGSGETEKHRFTSYERDPESNTDYAVNRQYQQANGRFMQPDLVEGSIADPQRLNRYTYTESDPINLFDPLGLDKCWVPDGKGGYVEIPCPPETDPSYPNDPPFVLHGWDTMPLAPLLDVGTAGWERSFNFQGSAKDAKAISGMLNICGATSSYGQYSSVSNGMWRSTLNGKSYPLSWGGNGATGARSLATEYAGALRVLGKSMFYAGSIISTVQGGQSLLQGNYGGAAKSGLDITMSRVGLMGPWGATASGIYFGVDMTVGWPYVGQELMLTRCDAECQYRLKHCTFANK
jgi:RHS repeat-associated protein